MEPLASAIKRLKEEFVANRKFLVFRVIVEDIILDNIKEKMSDSEKCVRLQDAIAFYFGCKEHKVTVQLEDTIG